MHLTIYWQNFTPVLSLLGGMLIGLAAAILVIVRGRIAGISGILGGLLGVGRSAMPPYWPNWLKFYLSIFCTFASIRYICFFRDFNRFWAFGRFWHSNGLWLH